MIVQVGQGKNVGRINPLQINPVAEVSFEDEDSEEFTTTKSPLALHLDFLQTFFKLYYPEVSSLEISILMEILEELYKTFGITYESDISTLKVNEFPVMKDLYELLEEKSKDETNKHAKEIEELRAVIRGLAIGNNAEIFNGYTSIDFNSDFCYVI